MALTGNGTLLGIIDSGIDYSHPDFRNEDGSTRIIALWDQTIDGNPPEGYSVGTLYTREQMNEALQKETREEQFEIVPSRDRTGHGTHVAGIAGGNGRASDQKVKGVAPEAEFIIVKISNPVPSNQLEHSNLEYALEFCVNTALEINKPIAVNISYGNNYGAHNGRSLFDNRMNQLALIGKSVVCCGMGNEGSSARHFEERFDSDKNSVATNNIAIKHSVEWYIAPGETLISVQLWKSYVDEFRITFIAPDGEILGILPNNNRLQQTKYRDTTVYLYSGLPTPIQIRQLLLVVLEGNPYIDTGIWTLEIEPIRVIDGDYHMWLPVTEGTNPNTGFLNPVDNTTLTIPATTERVVSVGAYDGINNRLVAFSGRGFTSDGRVKPDVVAPGVDITSCAPGGGYDIRSGTSMATPFVTGTAALMMEWGIVQNNDPSMYGERIRASMRRMALPLPYIRSYPDYRVGYGALNQNEILPNLYL
jgi:minor extracellular serine protease Vpr